MSRLGKNWYYCKINGKICNLEKGMEIFDKEGADWFMLWVSETYEIDLMVLTGFDEYIILDGYVIPPIWNTGMLHPNSDWHNIGVGGKRIQNRGVICPKCNSTRVRKISSLEKITSVAFLDYASDLIGKTYRCDTCRHKW